MVGEREVAEVKLGLDVKELYQSERNNSILMGSHLAQMLEESYLRDYTIQQDK